MPNSVSDPTPGPNPNAEFIAIRKIEKILQPFTRREKGRILQFVADRDGMGPTGPDPEKPGQMMNAARPPVPATP